MNADELRARVAELLREELGVDVLVYLQLIPVADDEDMVVFLVTGARLEA
jgi:hypothetical protein